IILRKDDGTQAHSVGGQELLLDAADGQNFAAQSDFAGHGHFVAHGIFRERANQGSGDSDAGGGAVLGDSAFGHVHVNIEGAVEILVEAESGGARTHVAHGGLRGFLHHFTELAGGRQATLAFHGGGFDGKYGAADFG